MIKVFDFCAKYVIVVINFLNGKFGRYRLNQPYRKVWRVITWTTVVVLAWIYAICPFFDWWQGIVNYMNYVVWG
jgi:hypothetical protein